MADITFAPTDQGWLCLAGVAATREQARQEIFEYIEGFYNRVRRHARLKYLSPIDFERQFYEMKQAA